MDSVWVDGWMPGRIGHGSGRIVIPDSRGRRAGEGPMIATNTKVLNFEPVPFRKSLTGFAYLWTKSDHRCLYYNHIVELTENNF